MTTVTNTGPLILFDGVCNLCNTAVQWVIARDQRATFRFASVQSAAARAAIEERIGADAAARLPDSIVLLDERGLHTRSTAALRIAAKLGFPWSLAAIWFVLPRFLRDPVYDFIARRRYRWFGKKDACMVPSPELRARFLDANEPPAAPRGS